MGITVDLPPIPGEPLDPPVKDLDPVQDFIDDRSHIGGVIFRAWYRFVESRLTLLAAGTTYFLFLSVISLIAFAYGTFALLGADPLAEWLTDTLNSAFPGLIGADGISPESIRQYGTVASVIGLIFLAWAGTGSLYEVNRSLHLIFGAPKDPRNYFLNRLKMFVMLVILGPIALLSFVPSIAITALATPIQGWLGLESTLLIGGVTTLLSTALNFLILYVCFSMLGGIRPSRRSRVIGALAGAIAAEALKFASAIIISWSLSKPQYGAFAVPITALLMLYLLTTTAYLAACLTAGIATKAAHGWSLEDKQVVPAAEDGA